MSKTKSELENDLVISQGAITDQKIDKLLFENMKQEQIILAKDSELARLVPTKSLINNPLLANAKNVAMDKKETIKNAPFEVNKMPFRFQVTPPLSG